MAPIERGWYYFGCIGTAGHGLYVAHIARGGKPPYLDRARYGHYFEKFDNTLCHPEARPMQVALVRFASIGYTALAFPDRTGDSRGGSNSVIFAPSPTITAQGIISTLDHVLPKSLLDRWPPFDLSRLEYEPAAAAPAQAPGQG